MLFIADLRVSRCSRGVQHAGGMLFAFSVGMNQTREAGKETPPREQEAAVCVVLCV